MVSMSWILLLSDCVCVAVLSKDADIDEEMAEMIDSEIESLSEQLKLFEEKLKVQVY